MALVAAPFDERLQPHLMDVAIDDIGRFYYAALTRDSGMFVWWTVEPNVNLLDRLPPQRQYERALLWGAPRLSWRPTDGQLLLSSVTRTEDSIMLLPIPGIFQRMDVTP